ncbi:hypothetical protein QBZ16_001690 [Prototheca wickerhamii]|uniref:UTP--glucose-1-phosphate uridylyltransferase n=1 Tax=Prototheca wickerhamii TaxID=3111 RepID=A0AAD9IG66_PROWI|nr:hypothetical protein QBZ16_001690 [Prototheca wickerhamii]
MWLPESDIEPVTELPELESLKSSASEAELQSLLSKTAMLKLNGGLGTSMGLEKAKSLLVVKDGKTFLDLIAEQVKYTRKRYGCNVRFVLMNSFSTSADTKEYLGREHADLMAEPDVELLQNASPKVDAATLKPATYAPAPELECGLLDRLLAEGVEYLFVSNSDNLGATLDLDLLRHVADSGSAFVMEVARRTASDKKGGHLARRAADGRLVLRESAQCPDGDKAAFRGRGPAQNKKTVNPRDSSSAPVFQLETAMGAAIECFPDAGAVVVPRSRFAPVKTCSDLLVLRSDAYKITPAATVELVEPTAPAVKLDDKHYKLVDQMERLVKAVPSLWQAESLTVKGPVVFERGVVVRGNVVLENASSEPLAVKSRVLVNTTIDLVAEHEKSDAQA